MSRKERQKALGRPRGLQLCYLSVAQSWQGGFHVTSGQTLALIQHDWEWHLYSKGESTRDRDSSVLKKHNVW